MNELGPKLGVRPRMSEPVKSGYVRLCCSAKKGLYIFDAHQSLSSVGRLPFSHVALSCPALYPEP